MIVVGLMSARVSVCADVGPGPASLQSFRKLSGRRSSVHWAWRRGAQPLASRPTKPKHACESSLPKFCSEKQAAPPSSHARLKALMSNNMWCQGKEVTLFGGA